MNLFVLVMRNRYFRRRFCSLIIILSLLIFFLNVVISGVRNQIKDYETFLRNHPFYDIAFWQDNRTTKNEKLFPIKKFNDVQLSNSSIVVSVCARDVEKYLKNFQKNIRQITDLFGDYRILFCESESTDGTLNFLQRWRNDDSKHVRIITKGKRRFSFSSRTNRLAECRNDLFQMAFDYYFDYYFVIDVDVGASMSFDIDDFRVNFIYPSDSWIAFTATQRSEYYDIWALRIAPVLPFDCWAKITELTSFYLDKSPLIKRFIKVHQKPIPKTFPLIPVQSAFGGAALYSKRFLVRNCSYNGYEYRGFLRNSQVCEHVSFHQCLIKYSNGRYIYINPNFQIT